MNKYLKYFLVAAFAIVSFFVLRFLFFMGLITLDVLSTETRSLALSTDLANVELVDEVILDTELDTFVVPAHLENGILYVSYGYSRDSEPRMVQAFYYDFATKSVTDKSLLSDLILTDVCEGDSGIVLDSSTDEASAVQVISNEITTLDTETSCRTEIPVPRDCEVGSELFRQLLPRSNQELAVCYNPDSRNTTFHSVTEEGELVTLGTAGTSPGGSGRFVAQEGTQSGTYLVHHTQSAISESAVLVDTNNLSVTDVDLPDLTAARPSRGFGAGNHGVQLHPIATGYLAEGRGGQAFLIQNDETTLLADDLVFGSVVVSDAGCSATMLTQNDEADSVVVLKEFTLCQEDV